MDVVQNFSDDNYNIPNLASFKTVRIYVFSVILSINSDYFIKFVINNIEISVNTSIIM